MDWTADWGLGHWRLELDPDGGKDRKVPYDPKADRKASSTNPGTWASYDAAKGAFEKYIFSGLGLVVVKDGGIVGVDIDACRDPDTGELNCRQLAKDAISGDDGHHEEVDW